MVIIHGHLPLDAVADSGNMKRLSNTVMNMLGDINYCLLSRLTSQTKCVSRGDDRG